MTLCYSEGELLWLSDLEVSAEEEEEKEGFRLCVQESYSLVPVSKILLPTEPCPLAPGPWSRKPFISCDPWVQCCSWMSGGQGYVAPHTLPGLVFWHLILGLALAVVPPESLLLHRANTFRFATWSSCRLSPHQEICCSPGSGLSSSLCTQCPLLGCPIVSSTAPSLFR